MITPTMVLIQLSSGQWMALTPEEVASAMARASELMPAVTAAPTTAQAPAVEVLTAEQMSERFSIAASWFMEQARFDQIPFLKCGKYIRFEPAAVARALAHPTDQRLVKPLAAPKPHKKQAQA
jgi:hypothetical protein